MTYVNKKYIYIINEVLHHIKVYTIVRDQPPWCNGNVTLYFCTLLPHRRGWGCLQVRPCASITPRGCRPDGYQNIFFKAGRSFFSSHPTRPSGRTGQHWRGFACEQCCLRDSSLVTCIPHVCWNRMSSRSWQRSVDDRYNNLVHT